ncbi:MAG TPA: hypothetical protein VKV18_01020 [Chthonomonas sp.]|uniref:hypothetical protein n=1 Tax=Chthonomonas sp. TaxID=2282153 RepID=UPI002B4B86A9|nr:hypothetical protein [Chthonomonas sp.]HLI47260.1 hypothetical protein [Chthonomonas sp.]
MYDDTFCRLCFDEAYRYARRCKQPDEDAREFAAAFVGCVLHSKVASDLWHLKQYRMIALRNFMGKWTLMSRKHQHESLPEDEAQEGDESYRDVIADTPTCEVMRKEFYERLKRGIAKLTPSQQYLIQEHLIEGVPLKELLQKVQTGERKVTHTYDALKKAYARALKRLASELTRQGFDFDEASTYLPYIRQLRGGGSQTLDLMMVVLSLKNYQSPFALEVPFF